MRMDWWLVQQSGEGLAAALEQVERERGDKGKDEGDGARLIEEDIRDLPGLA